MSLKFVEEFRNSEISQSLARKIKEIAEDKLTIMEVCGTHTVSIFRNGIRSLLPETITLLSGPGCPVCVTSQSEIDTMVKFASKEKTIVTVFGDLMRVPGSETSLHGKRAEGCDVRIVYSAMDALAIAKKNPDKKIVFPGVGFETTAPTIAAAILAAEKSGLENFSVYSAHKMTPPAIDAVLKTGRETIDALLLPGHVAVIVGEEGFRAVTEKYEIPSAVTGFEPMDILSGILTVIEQNKSKNFSIQNRYKRAVKPEGNPKAIGLMMEVFKCVDTPWRGIGVIPESGLKIRDKYKNFNAEILFDIEAEPERKIPGCMCGEILTGRKKPMDCPLYKKKCTPVNPVGPCMVSSEGTCAAYYKYS